MFEKLYVCIVTVAQFAFGCAAVLIYGLTIDDATYERAEWAFVLVYIFHFCAIVMLARTVYRHGLPKRRADIAFFLFALFVSAALAGLTLGHAADVLPLILPHIEAVPFLFAIMGAFLLLDLVAMAAAFIAGSIQRGRGVDTTEEKQTKANDTVGEW